MPVALDGALWRSSLIRARPGRPAATDLARRQVLGYTVDANGMIVDDKQARAAKARLAELDDAADGGATRRIGDIPYPVWWCRDNIAPLGDPSCMRHNPDEW